MPGIFFTSIMTSRTGQPSFLMCLPSQKLELVLKILKPGEMLSLDGICFQHCAFVRALVDGVDILNEFFFRDGVIVFQELLSSVSNSGHYLIFTCACGVADDGGWQRVYVQHSNNLVKWSIIRGGKLYECFFDFSQYKEAILKLKASVRSLDPLICLEPSEVFPPESDTPGKGGGL